MIDEWKKGAKYWDKAWNPVIGCKPASEGCNNCYAARLAAKFPELQDDQGGFTPHAPKALKVPPKSGVVFVGNMTDLFGEWNDDQEILKWLKLLSDNAVNLILTKRAYRLKNMYDCLPEKGFWFGVTAENQQQADNRIPDLLRMRQRVVASEALRFNKWVSIEPLLGPVDIIPYIGYNAYKCECGWHKTERNLILSNPKSNGFWGWCTCKTCGKGVFQTNAVSWVVVGAESGPNRRPCKLEWVESIVSQCQASNVPVFVKQIDINGKLEKDITKFPQNLQIRQVPWGKESLR